jgi:nicotinamide-nucleotide amidase
MKATIITIGDELLNGQTIDTNSAFIAKELNKIGITVFQKWAISDDENEIKEALKNATQKTSIIIFTGGLGPTNDDITKKTLASYFNVGYKRDEETLAHVAQIFAQRNKPFLAINEAQADVPTNCTVLFNASGTAPGMWFDDNGVKIISLPGVPNEMKHLMTVQVIPRLLEAFTLPIIIHKHIQTVGIGESFLAEKIKDIEAEMPENVKLAYLPNFAKVHLRITGKGENEIELEKLTSLYHKLIADRVAEHVYSLDERSQIQVVSDLLIEKKKKIALAESCTGGYLSQLFTSVAGSSGYFDGGAVVYSYDLKHKFLGVSNDLLNSVGAVSEECVEAMVKGLLNVSTADIGVAISGIAGPSGGTEDKPVGTVWIAVGNREKMISKKHQFFKNRNINIECSVVMALEMVRVFLMKE